MITWCSDNSCSKINSLFLLSGDRAGTPYLIGLFKNVIGLSNVLLNRVTNRFSNMLLNRPFIRRNNRPFHRLLNWSFKGLILMTDPLKKINCFVFLSQYAFNRLLIPMSFSIGLFNRLYSRPFNKLRDWHSKPKPIGFQNSFIRLLIPIGLPIGFLNQFDFFTNLSNQIVFRS